MQKLSNIIPMKLKQLIFSLLCFILLTAPTVYGQLKSPPKAINNQVLVRMQEGKKPAYLLKFVPAHFELTVAKVLSLHSDIWLLEFNAEQADISEVIQSIQSNSNVLYTQPNREVQLRAAPNDNWYNYQWQYDNIDAELAWDITTGGTTANGHEIVVALIESADLINHEDLKDNHWKNTAEIPENGIDDDGNGYIDDYNGWNVSTGTDAIGTGGHGTSCAGMIGAKGNNEIGVTGINWDVKIMSIAGHNMPFTEANIIEAYTYALNARLLWNQSNGTSGAFVVATSSSWGLDEEDPNDYPIWCSFYDDLGQAGILNVGATTNENQNVDTWGDVPTGCASDYMIGVTATNSSDIIDFAGYGKETIDVAAPGSSIYTTAQNNGYTTTSGTSFACPLTAGLIGLMYSIPCNNLDLMALNNPQGTADIVRNALYNGVDKNAHLMLKTVTGGRINAKNSIDFLMNEVCDDCSPPSNINITSIQEYSAEVSFDSSSSADAYRLWIQVAESGNWSSYSITGHTHTFTGLTSCTQYEFYITSDCSGEISIPSLTTSFTTTGCGNCTTLNYCETKANRSNPSFTISSPSSIEGTYNYSPTTFFGGNVNDGYNYGELVLVNDGTALSHEGCNTLINSAEIAGNIAVVYRGTCEFITKVMNAQNAGATAVIVINNVASAPIEMVGTNENITIPAVMISQADGTILTNVINNDGHPMGILGSQNEWIESFEIDNYLFETGDNDGYLLQDSHIILNPGEDYPFTLVPGYEAQNLPEYTRIWLDVNQDGIFDTSELLYNQGSASTAIVNGTITIPTSATTGSTRMRVQMSFQGNPSAPLPSQCGNFVSGEVEDYCINIVAQGCGMTVNSNVIQPECSGLNNGQIELTMTNGAAPFTYLWNNGNSTPNLSNLSANNYLVKITDDNGCDTLIYFSLDYTRDLTVSATVTPPTCSDSDNGEISLDVQGGNTYSYAWSNGETTSSINGLTHNSYSVMITDELGCQKFETYTLSTPVNPTLVADFTSASDNLTLSFTNTSINAVTYLWDFGDGETSTINHPVHTFQEKRTYNVCLTAYGACSTITKCQNIVVEDVSGLSINNKGNAHIIIFPNPAKGKIILQKENPYIKSVIVYNPNGQLVYTTSLKEDQTIIDIEQWATGNYTFQLVDQYNETITTRKVSVVH